MHLLEVGGGAIGRRGIIMPLGTYNQRELTSMPCYKATYLTEEIAAIMTRRGSISL